MKFILQIQFFGRGRSKAGGGGGSTSGTSSTATGGNAQILQSPPPTQTVPDDTNVAPAPAPSASYNAFMAMTDDQKADAIIDAISKPVPDHLNNSSDLQKVIYHLNLNDKPQVVDDATFRQMNGTEMTRAVDQVYNSSADINYTAPQIAAQISRGRITRVSSDRRAFYGDGIYFAKGMTGYGNTRGDINKTCIVSAKLNSNARIITYDACVAGVRREIRSGSRLGRALSQCKTRSAHSIYALAKGYNVIDANNLTGYLNVIDRRAMTVNATITPKP